MQPVLFTIANFPVSSFGLLLVIGIILGSFVMWRIVRVYDLDQEKTLDLILIVSFISLIFSRLYFIAVHPQQFNSVLKVVDIVHHPGLPFWGAFWGGLLGLSLLMKRFKLHPFQMLDIATVGFFLIITFSSIGCLLGSCEYGLPSDSFFAVTQKGVYQERIPLQLIQAIVSFLAFLYFWHQTLRFHNLGQIFAKGLIILGVIKLSLEPFRPVSLEFFGFNISYLFELLLLIGGFFLYYQKSRRSVFGDIKYTLSILYNSSRRKALFLTLAKKCYNLLVLIRYKLTRLQKSIFKLFNIRSNPNNF